MPKPLTHMTLMRKCLFSQIVSEEVDEEDDGDTVHKSSDRVSAAAASSGDGRSTDLEPLAMQTSDHIDGPFGESDISCP